MDTLDSFAVEIEKLLTVCQAQYGESMKSCWFYEGQLCPCCAQRQVGIFKFKQEDSFSLNTFMYYEMSVLIGYALCGICMCGGLGKSVKETPREDARAH